LDYEQAADAFVNLDGTEFSKGRLHVSFAKSSIATEDELKKQLHNDRFQVTVNTRRQQAG